MSSREIYDGMDGVTTRTFKFRDPVVDNVCREFVKRSDAGYKKYGSTLDDERRLGMKNLQGYLKTFKKSLWMLYCIYKQHVKNFKTYLKKL